MEELKLTKDLRALTIDPEFRDLIPSPSDEERALLEDSIVANGCESPLFIWNGVIVDGHNRYEICQKHSIPFAVVVELSIKRDTQQKNLKSPKHSMGDCMTPSAGFI